MSERTVAVVVAHPDDEVLGFGGTMCRHAAAGDRVHVLILATGSTARADGPAPHTEDLATLRGEAEAAGGVLGVAGLSFADFPDNRMDTVALLDVVKRVESFIDGVAPQVVYTHHAGDLNIDHAIVARAVLTACRPVPGAAVRKIYAGEILSSSEYAAPDDRFRPTTYIDISAFVERKRDALRCYTTEVRRWPHPRSTEAVEALARLRGSECGLEAAEALCLIREIEC